MSQPMILPKWKRFYEMLNQQLNQILTTTYIGDLNARIENENLDKIVKRFSETIVNDNGDIY